MTTPTPATPTSTTSEILSLIHAHGESDYIGEPISQLAHCLQCAHSARHATSPPVDSATVIAALLHDIGQFLPAADAGVLVQDMRTAADGGSVGRVGHETIGAEYLRKRGFGEKVCALVGSHVQAKRYLCAVEPGYWAKLSEASKKSLEVQGGTMGREEVEKWEAAPWGMEMCRVRKWDDGAKVVGLEVDGLESYRGEIERYLEGR